MADQRGVILLLLCTCLTIEAAPVQPPQFAKEENISYAEIKVLKVKLSLQELKKNSTELDQFNVKEIAYADFLDQHILPPRAQGDPPTLSFECKYNCDSKLNPASKFILKGIGKSKGNERIQYRWEARCPTEHADCKFASYKSEVSNNDGTTSLIIKLGFFKVGSYKIILFGKVEGGDEGNSTYKVTVNEPPKGGHCEVNPTEGKPLDPYFSVSCKGFHDDDQPLQYEFFYTNDLSPDGQPKYHSLGSELESARTNLALPNGLEKYDYKFKFRVKVTDNLGASNKLDIDTMVTVKEVKFSVKDLQDKVKDLDQLAASGNVKETANVVAAVATVLNEQKAEEKSADDIEKGKKLRAKLVTVVVKNAHVTKDTSPADLAQMCNTISAATAVPEENSNEMTEKVSSFIENAGEAILKQASGEGASSEKIQEASEALFGTAVNVIRSVDQSKNDEQSSSSELQQAKEASENIIRKALNTVNTLAKALLVTKVPGEDETKIETSSLAIGVSREKADDIGNKSIDMGGSKVTVPANLSDISNLKSSLEQVGMLSHINLYAGKERSGQIRAKVVALSLDESKANSSQVAFNILDSAINKTLIVQLGEGGDGHKVYRNSSSAGWVVNHL